MSIINISPIKRCTEDSSQCNKARGRMKRYIYQKEKYKNVSSLRQHDQAHR